MTGHDERNGGAMGGGASSGEELSGEDRGVVAALERYGRTEPHPASPWPGLHGAIRRDRRVRQARRGAGAVAAVLAVAIALPFTPVRVEPLDQLAAAIGLRDGGHDGGHSNRPYGRRQDVRPGDDDYRDDAGDPLPSLASGRIRDAAWLAEAADRAEGLVLLDGETPGTKHEAITLWAGDDGARTRAVVGFRSQDDRVHVWAALSGPTGSSAGDLELASLSDRLSPAKPFAPGADRGLVADYRPRDPAVTLLAGYPRVDSVGVVTTVWHATSEVIPGLWLGDLGPEGARGWIASTLRGGVSQEVSTPAYGNPTSQPARPGSHEDFLGSSPLGSFQDLGYAGASRELSFEGFGVADDYVDFGTDGEPGITPPVVGETRADVRIVGVRSPGGGWLVSGDLTATGFLGGGESVTFERIGSRAVLDVVAAPATPSRGTPLVGLIAPRLDSGDASGYVLVWAPPEITAVRSGAVTAPVVDGLALLDLRQGRGDRVHQGELDQAVLIQGLDESGAVVARSRVNERDFKNWTFVGGEDGEGKLRPPGPHDATSAVVMPTIRWP